MIQVRLFQLSEFDHPVSIISDRLSDRLPATSKHHQPLQRLKFICFATFCFQKLIHQLNCCCSLSPPTSSAAKPLRNPKWSPKRNPKQNPMWNPKRNPNDLMSVAFDLPRFKEDRFFIFSLNLRESLKIDKLAAESEMKKQSTQTRFATGPLVWPTTSARYFG